VSAPLVSCIVPVFNGALHLGETIESILAQTYRPIEVLVVDDGSTDGSAEVAERYGDPVRVLRQANAGATEARNAAVRVARGDLIAFLDADDLWSPEKLEVQLEHLAAHPELDATFCQIENFFDDEVARAEEARWREHDRVVGSYVLPTLVVRREALERVPLDGRWRHGDHVDWTLRAREAGVRFDVLPRVLAHRRRHAGNMSRTAEHAVFDDYFDLIKAKLDRARRAGDG
jgi:glycosyltransferase involved in cell wall biosynthesis